MRLSFLVSAAVACSCVVACSSGPASDGNNSGGDSGPGCGDAAASSGSCTPYVSCADLTPPTVSFSSAVLPVFNRSCGIGGEQCHGDPNSSPHTAQPYLGQSPGTPDVAKIFAGLINQPAAEDTKLSLIAPGDPEKSYLVHKIDGDSCQFAAECNVTGNPLIKNCGIQMPFNAGSLDPSMRDTIRRWIAQGAKNN